jgi:hypothetical protein
MKNYIGLILENLNTIMVIISALIALIRMTAWGRANQIALDTVTEAIEKLDAKEVKEKIKAIHDTLPDGAANALKDSVRKVDKDKVTPSAIEMIAEIAMIRPRQKP